VAAAALHVIDSEGLEALSIERIAAELGVRGPSLYHHFPDKASILSAVAGLVLGDLEMTHDEVDDWRSVLVGASLTFYRRVLQHPRAAAILMEYLPDADAVPGLGLAARALDRARLDASTQALLIEGCEKITWGWSLHRAFTAVAGDHRASHPDLDRRWPELRRALSARDQEWPDDEAMLERALRAFIVGVVSDPS